MKLLRHGPKGQEKPALLHTDGTVRDLSAVLPDIGPSTLSPTGMAALASLDASTLPVVEPGRLAVPWTGMRKFIAIGLNYADHAAEANMPIPQEPIVFTKTVDCAVGCNHPVVLPQGSVKTDWEVELGVVIGKTAKYVSEADAMDYVAGYCVSHDVSERAFQTERAGQWTKGKSCDTFGPIGPWLVTTDELPDPHAIGLWLEVNGQRMQDGHTSQFIFGVPQVLAYISQFMRLEPGDIVLTGTPAGVGLGQKPAPWFLKPGDVMRLGGTGLGEQVQTCVGG